MLLVEVGGVQDAFRFASFSLPIYEDTFKRTNQSLKGTPSGLEEERSTLYGSSTASALELSYPPIVGAYGLKGQSI